MYTLSSAYALEGRVPTPETERAWVLTDLRVRRHTGDPGKVKWPFEHYQSTPQVDVSTLRPSVRLHHYSRVLSSADCRTVNSAMHTYCLGIKVTEEWHDPTDGIIKLIPNTSPILGTHCVGGVIYDPQRKMFGFPNSWGVNWGKRGFGFITPEILDKYMVECWTMVGLARYPPLAAKSGIIALLWKSGVDGHEVHGRELVDAGSGERIGWCFLVRRDGFLDIEELFVWPEHRRKGYGAKLASLAIELAAQMRAKLRALVSYADAEPTNRDAVTQIFRLLQLFVHPSTMRGIAFLGLPSPFIGRLEEPDIPPRPTSTCNNLDPARGTRLYTVWFGTNRKPKNQSNLSMGFSAQRDDRVHHGFCNVSIPRTHTFGSVGTKWLYRWLRVGNDDRLRVSEVNCFQETEFWTRLSDTLLQCDKGERHGLVYIHGYNVDFDEAAIRAAQIGFDLKVKGVTAFFSWPSCGTVSGYPTDETCIEASEHFIADFLRDFVKRSGVERVHLIAHSMGNRGLIRALQKLSTGVSDETGVMFDQIILAAPDIDSVVFSQLAYLFRQFSQRTTLYTSPMDIAISASQWLHSYPRAGLVPPVTIVPGIDTVEIPKLNVFDLLGHSYYAEAEGVLHDMFDLIRRNAPPSDRQRLAEVTSVNGQKYWVMNS